MQSFLRDSLTNPYHYWLVYFAGALLIGVLLALLADKLQHRKAGSFLLRAWYWLIRREKLKETLKKGIASESVARNSYEEDIRESRKKLISEARAYITSDSFDEKRFEPHDLFFRLEPYLGNPYDRVIQSGRSEIAILEGNEANYDREWLLQNLSRIEREWNLV